MGIIVSTCKLNDCDNKSRARGYCDKHYQRVKKYGDPYVKHTTSKHGMSGTPEHWAWKAIKRRCYAKGLKQYSDYGGRGIKVCDRWLKSFEDFYADMGPRPSKDHSIDRVNNNGNYEPSNCVWATRKKQNNNSRHNHYIKIEGVTRTLAQWTEEYSLGEETIRQRLKRGLSGKDLIAAPNPRYLRK